MDELLAEIAGIMFGDGHLTNKKFTYKLVISLNLKKDERYSEHIQDLFERRLKIRLKRTINRKKNSLNLYYFSKYVVEKINMEVKMPLGRKKLIEIPKDINAKEKYLIKFIKGLFDTDGCITTQKDKNYKYPLIKITTKHKMFAENIKKSLRKLSIRSFICTKIDKNKNIGYDIVARNLHARKFIKLIGSSNERNKNKWEQEWGHWDSNF